MAQQLYIFPGFDLFMLLFYLSAASMKIPIIIKYSVILLVALLIEWWVTSLSSLSIPDYFNIYKTPINVSGLFLIVILITTLRLVIKSVIKTDPDTSIYKLTLMGTIICFLSEVVFQIVRQFTLTTDRLYYFLLGTLGITVFGTVFSFFIAYQLKTKKTGHILLFIVGFIIIVNIIKYFFPSITG